MSPLYVARVPIHSIAERPCPACGVLLSSAINGAFPPALAALRPPPSGTFGVCNQCGVWLRLTHDGTVRLFISPIDELELDGTTRYFLARASAAIRALRGKA